MELKIREHANASLVYEGNHQIYTVVVRKNNHLMELSLQNSYGDDIMCLSQLSKWYARLLPLRFQKFCIYTETGNAGIIQWHKHEYALMYHGVQYKIFVDLKQDDKKLKYYDRKEEIASCILQGEMKLQLKNSSMNAIFILTSVLVNHLEKKALPLISKKEKTLETSKGA